MTEKKESSFMEKGFNFEDDPFSSDNGEYAALFERINSAPKDLYDKYYELFYNVYPGALCDPAVMEKYNNPANKRNIHYGPSDAQTFDIWYPNEGKGPFPVVINLHAGGFSGGSADDFTLPPMFRACDHGYALVSLNYRLSGEAKWPASVYDVKAAVRYLRAHAAELNIDPNKIISWGYSAGAYLSAMLAVTGDEEMFNDAALGNMDQSSKVQAAIVGSGPCGNWADEDAYLDELSKKTGVPVLFPHNAPNSVEAFQFGQPLPRIYELLRLVDPNVWVNESCPPVLLLHGDEDPLVPFEFAVKFHEKIASKIGPDKTDLIVGPGKHHCDDPFFQDEERFEMCFAFLDKHLGKTEAEKKAAE